MNRENDFKERSLGVWTWILWAGLTLLMGAYTIYSTYELWPSLIVLAVLGALVTLVCSWYVTGHTREIDKHIRQRAIIGFWVMTGAAIVNVGAHGFVSRYVHSIGEQEVKQKAEREDRNRLANEEAARQERILKATGDTLDKARRQSDSATYQAKKAGVAPPPPPKISLPQVKADQPIKINEVTASAADALQWSFWVIFIGFMLQLVADVVGSGVVHHARIEDRNANGIPDYIERIFQDDPEYARMKYPNEYARLMARHQSTKTNKDEFPNSLDFGPKA